MQVGVLATNGGKHSDEKLAIACAAEIVQIGAEASGEQAIEGRKLENQIIAILEGHFRQVADFEHDELATKGADHLAGSWAEPHPEIWNDAVSKIMDAVKASPISGWFSTEAVEGNVRNAVGRWVGISQH